MICRLHPDSFCANPPQTVSKPTPQPAKGITVHRKGWTLRRCTSFDDMRVQAIRDWQRVRATIRTDAAWEMVVEAWKMKHWNLDELRLQRTVTVLRKA